MKSLRYAFFAVGLLLTLPSPARSDDSTYVSPSRATDIDQKLKSIVVSVDFTNATIEQAVAALTTMSQRADPSHKGIVFIVQPEASSTAKPITLKLNKVPLGETIRYVCLLSNVGYKVSDKFVSLTPLNWTGWEIEKRTFHVDPSFVETAQQSGVIPTPQKSP